MSSPKDITGSLSSWSPSKKIPAPPNRQSFALRRLRPDIFGGMVYACLVGLILSQFVFMGLFFVL